MQTERKDLRIVCTGTEEECRKISSLLSEGFKSASINPVIVRVNSHPKVNLDLDGRLMLGTMKEVKFFTESVTVTVDAKTKVFGSGSMTLNMFEIIEYAESITTDKLKADSKKSADEQLNLPGYVEEKKALNILGYRKASIFEDKPEAVRRESGMTGMFHHEAAFVDMYFITLRLLNKVKQLVKEPSFKYNLDAHIDKAEKNLGDVCLAYVLSFMEVYDMKPSDWN